MGKIHNVQPIAIKYKEKVNKMAVTNGSIFLLSHMPEFIVTLLVVILKKNLSFYCYYYLLFWEYSFTSTVHFKSFAMFSSLKLVLAFKCVFFFQLYCIVLFKTITRLFAVNYDYLSSLKMHSFSFILQT